MTVDRKCLRDARTKIWELEAALDYAYWCVLKISDPEMGWTVEELKRLDVLLDNCSEPAWFEDAAIAIHNMCERWHVDCGDDE